MSATAALTRKAGPLPVWGWAVLALAATWFLFFRAPRAAGGTQLPYTPQRGSAAQQPASGQGTPVDNANSDLLAALGQQSSAYDALLAALQQGGGGYGTGGAAGGVPPSSPGAFTAAATAPSIGADNPPQDPGAPASPSPSFPAPIVGGPYYAEAPAYTSPSGYTYTGAYTAPTSVGETPAAAYMLSTDPGFVSFVTPPQLKPGGAPQPGKAYVA